MDFTFEAIEKLFRGTSFNTSPALDASVSQDAPGLIFEIEAKRGAYLDHKLKLTTFEDEAELLLPNRTKYKVIGVEREAEFESDMGATKYRTIIRVRQL